MIFHHLGLVVSKIADGQKALEQVFGAMSWESPICDPIQKVNVCFGRQLSSEVLYELIEPLSSDSPIAETLKSKRNILNHVAYKTNTFDAKRAELRSLGYMPVTKPQPAVAFGGARVVFLLTPLNFILELIED